ncbi:MAG: LCP family protein [Candidatus Levyibacteriota bacterium]
MRKKIIFIILGVIALFFLSQGMREISKFAPVLWQLFFSRDISLKKEDNNINILALGIGGGTHEGPRLTDTIIFSSINLKDNKITLISVPRDLWVPDLNAKINDAYNQGEVKRKGGGLILSKAVVASVLNQQIDYAIRVDFDGFVKAVDLIGGLEIAVDNTFDDYEYPIEGKENDICGHSEEEVQLLATASSQLEAFPCRYTNIHFDKGVMLMNGNTALQYVRSRHAKGIEGSDFARSKRQEKVIKAFKDKLFSTQTILNPFKIISLYNILKSHIDTDIKQEEYDDFTRLFSKVKNANIKSTVIDYGDSANNRPGLLVNPLTTSDFKYQWVLIPRIGNGNFSEIKKFVECEIKTGNCPVSVNPSP